MRALVYGGLSLIVLVVALIIGGAMIDKTNNVVTQIVGENATVTPGLVTSGADTLTTFSSMVPLVALGLIGAMALAYIFGMVGGGGKG